MPEVAFSLWAPQGNTDAGADASNPACLYPFLSPEGKAIAMCYSAQVEQEYNTYVHLYGADISIHEFVRLYGMRQAGLPIKIPKGMDLNFREPKWPAELEVRNLIDDFNLKLLADTEQDLFAQVKRLADAERKLALKETKAALNDQRVATNKIKQFKRWIADAKRWDCEAAKDDRIFPDWYCPVIVIEDGRRVVKPMRYHCRPAGMPASSDRTRDGKISGKYNARRDNLEKFWRNQFGYSHGIIVANVFYENVEINGRPQELQFRPRTGEPMLIACLWSRWQDPKGAEPDLLSVAAITDEPEPEVAAAGHDRTVINIKPEHMDAWLNPDPHNRDALHAIFDDKRHPYYEHRLAA